MADYGPQNVTDAGLTATYQPAAAGLTDRVPAGVLLHVLNTNAAARTLTLVTPGTFGGDGSLALPDRAINIPATTGSVFVRLLPYDLYRDPATGLVTLTWSANTGVTFAVLP